MGISNSWYCTKLILNGDIDVVHDYANRMNSGEVELTQGVSKITGHVVVPLADDLMQTQRMTIEELVESPNPCSGSVLATVCEIETGSTWYYQACTECAASISLLNGQLYCGKCGQNRTAVSRFKVHVVVMDDSGSITFVLFDRVVTEILGRNVADLIAEFNQGIGSDSYPPDLNMFINKQMLFKVEITKGHVNKRYNNYNVKRATDDAAIIQKFISLHNIKMCNEENEAEYNNALIELADNSPIKGASEFVDSTNNIDEVIVLSDCETPNSKHSGKRSAANMTSLTDNVSGNGESSTTKPLKKLARVKQEPSD
ncbi:uncharacterized protein LOC123910068 isoform X1 [Trifolium pratense]|nr:uncharacterized protein LOC123910068 isoform X1 [Trifolium pratense]XP_045817057.1 uncharacterized protein LOC123910068 isoform X1 [Trifolium pratense]XP_045817058.1 uncharacterized protein LOC123910068 isoform X1 [Trifolium pratense]XP_045817059.1 uncharacterized protein LOC123910068 isoform X1 [Trifolium pratense]XP_045817060.1 uncharacterized protein LOC123910068 isoform X1 [Trifolium pratense]